MKYNWIPMTGDFIEKGNTIVFKGKEVEYSSQSGNEVGAAFGEIIFNKNFSEGTISTEIEFSKISARSSCQIIINYNPNPTEYRLFTVGLNSGFSMFEIKEFRGGKWNFIASNGTGTNLKEGKKYKLSVTYTGSIITLNVDGIDVLSTKLLVSLPQSQVGLWCQNSNDIIIYDYNVQSVNPTAFVVMEFSGHYYEIYNNVISSVCEEFKVVAKKADDSFTTGMIISDIVSNINECKLIIADISPVNANVYYEVGYAHALNKPTILIAEKGTKLPFDVSPFRVLFYENSINGKPKLEEGLRKHLQEILYK